MNGGTGIHSRQPGEPTGPAGPASGKSATARRSVGDNTHLLGHRVAGAGMRGWVRAGLRLADLAPPDGDPEGLLRLPSCQLIKDQSKVTVGIVVPVNLQGHREATAALPIYVKRYNVFSLRVRVMSLFQRSPALRALAGTRMLAAAGFRTPTPVAAVEYRCWGMLEKSFFLTVQVAGAVPADQYWWGLRRGPVAARRTFVEGLAGLFADLHAAGIYHNDLKDANVLVRVGAGGVLEYFLLDLERVRRRRVLATRRRVKNLVQLHRTLGRVATLRENLYFLRAYLGQRARDVQLRRRWRRRICAAARRKDIAHVWRGVS